MTPIDLIADTCAAWGVSLRDFHGRHGQAHPGGRHSGGRPDMGTSRKRRPIPEARREVFRELRRLGWSTPRIGRLCGVDHSSVVRASRMP